jgi:hypothetical protein
MNLYKLDSKHKNINCIVDFISYIFIKNKIKMIYMFSSLLAGLRCVLVLVVVILRCPFGQFLHLLHACTRRKYKASSSERPTAIATAHIFMRMHHWF